MSPTLLSIRLALLTVVCLLPPAFLLARWLATGRGASRAWIETLSMLPLVLPPTVIGFYLLLLLSPTGTLGGWLATFIDTPLVFSFTGLLIASLIVNLPFALQPIVLAFRSIPEGTREAAWVSGLSRWQTLWRIELPLVWHGLLGAAAMVFAHTLGEFGVVLMVGGNIPGQTRTLSIAIYDSVQAFDMSGAAAMTFGLLIVSVVALIVVRSLALRHQRDTA